MLVFVVRRLISMVLVLFAVSVLTFLIFNVLPNGDPAERIAGKVPNPAQVQEIREQWGFDKPVYVQYVKTMEQIFSGDLISYFTQANVMDQIKAGAPRTFSLAIGAALIWMFFAIFLGYYGARHAGKFSDRAITILTLVGVSMPSFWLAALASRYLGFELNWFPQGGYVPFSESPWEWAYHLVLPWFTLAALYIGLYARVLRTNILETSHEDFVRTARAKGLSERQVMTRHVLRNSMIPVITLWGLDFGAVVGGAAILTETVFNLQGVGQYAADSIAQLDVPPVMAIVLFGAFFIVLLNTIVDLLYGRLDPRVRAQ
jgi:peptide/nickel transport system permease protein